MGAKTSPWVLSEELHSEEELAAFVNAIIALDDPLTLQAALGEVARMRGMRNVASAAGVNEKSLYRALSNEGNPRISTLNKVLDAFGLELRVVPKKSRVLVEG